MTELSEYEKKALAACVAWRSRRLQQAPRRIVPKGVRKSANKTLRRTKGIPGADRVGDALEHAATGLSKMVDRVTDLSLDPDRVLASFNRRGVRVASLDQLRAHDLKDIDRASRVRSLRTRYASAAAVEGGAVTLAITGGQVATTVSGAPGIGLIAAAAAGDAAATLSLASHVVTHTGFHYGYDASSSPEEDMFKMAVIASGMAVGQSAKSAAFAELYKLTMMLARRATWETLNANLIAKVATRFAGAFGERLTKKKLGQFVPVAGIGLGAGLNFYVIDQIGEAANWAYRERFLRDKLEAQIEGDVAHPVWEHTRTDPKATDEPILVLDLLDEAEREEGTDRS